MNIYYKHLKIVFISLVMLWSGCKTISSNENNSIKNKIPSTYIFSNDSLNSGQLKWKEFFTDKNLIALIDTALKNNPDLLMAWQKIEILKNEYRLNKSALLPNVSVGSSGAQRKYGLYTMDGAGNISTYMTPGQIVPIHLPDYYIGIQASWEIDLWGKLRNRKKSTMARFMKSIEGKNLITSQIISEIALNYYELLALDQELEIIRETIKLQKEAFEMVKLQKLATHATELGVKQFEAQVLISEGFELDIEQKITIIENRLNFLMGRFPEKINREKNIFLTISKSKINTGIPSDLLINRPDIKAAEMELYATKCDVAAARAAFYPSFNIMGGMGFQAFNQKYLFTTPQSIAYSLVGNLLLPIINRNAIKAQFKTAKAIQLDALYAFQKTVLNSYVEVYNEISNITKLEQIYELKKKEVNAFNRSIEISNDLFKAGLINYLEVLIPQKSALQSKLDLIDIQKRQLNATVNLYKALGGGWK